MKNNYKLLVMLLLATTINYAQQTVLFDFGGVFNTALTIGENYNNMTEDVYFTKVGDHTIVDMINDTGASTGFGFAITGNFQYFNEAGPTGTTGDAAFFHDDATKDSLFTKDDEDGNGEITFSGLDDSKFYSFEIFSSRATDENRLGQFTITGSNSVVGELNAGSASGGTGNLSNTLLIENIQPNAGNISIALEIAAGADNIYAYMNSLKMVETDTAVSVEDEILANGGLQLFPNPVNDVLNINYILNDSSKSSILIYDITGRLIYNASNSLNQVGTYSYKWNRLDNNGQRVAPGAYFLTLSTDSSNVTKKLILK